MPVRRALISVSDKTGLTDFARALHGLGIEILSTGGTARALAAAGIGVTDIQEWTGFPEIMDGRVKTLHPKVHGGLLAVRGNRAHRQAQEEHGIGDIDLLAVNLYPFEETVAAGGSASDTIEAIDVGGPAMIRAAAKNHESVTVIVDPADYHSVADELRAHGGSTTLTLRQGLAAKAFARTAAYDAAIARWFAGHGGNALPPYFAIGGKRLQALRYGENPHQQAALYRVAGNGGGIANAQQHQGKELSFNNFNDADAAIACASEFDPTKFAACVIVKHANPCGAALGASPLEAYRKALRSDPVSAFGGIVVLNRRLDEDVAAAIVELFTEVIVAPSVGEAARRILSSKSNLRVLTLEPWPDPHAQMLDVRTIGGGLLVQARDTSALTGAPKVVTARAPTAGEWLDLEFAFRVAKHVKSNAIVYAKDGATVGIGAGQMSRVDAVTIAVRKGADAARAAGADLSPIQGSVVASDAFFPFSDGLLQAAEAGATAIIQPGGSIRDAEIIEAANTAGLAMVFTGVRHFKH